MQAHAVPEGLWNLLAVLLQSRDEPIPEEKLKHAAEQACNDAEASPQLLKRLQTLLAQHGLCQ